jgi:hypothetical protein
MDAGSLDERPVALSRRVVDCQGELRLVGDQGLDDLTDQAGGDVLGLLAGRRDRRVARSELDAQASGTNPTCHGPPPAGQDRPEEQPGQPGGGSTVEICSETHCNSDVSRQGGGTAYDADRDAAGCPGVPPLVFSPDVAWGILRGPQLWPRPNFGQTDFFQFFRANAQTFLAICRYIVLVAYRIPGDCIREPTTQLPPLSTAQAPGAASATARGLPGKRTPPPRIALYPAAEVRQTELPV